MNFIEGKAIDVENFSFNFRWDAEHGFWWVTSPDNPEFVFMACGLLEAIAKLHTEVFRLFIPPTLPGSFPF